MARCDTCDMIPIVTPRLVLRPLVRSDLRALHTMYGDARMMRHITGYPRTPWQTGARLRKDLRDHREHGFGLCLGLLREGGAVVGRFGLEPRPIPAGLDGELAWMTLPPYRGRGLAVEAGRALIDYGYGELGLGRIYATTHVANAASTRVMERLGMSRTGDDGTILTFDAPRPARATG